MTQVKTTREQFAGALDLLHEVAMYIPMIEETMDDLDKATGREAEKIDNHLEMLLGAVYDAMNEYVNGKSRDTDSDELPF